MGQPKPLSEHERELIYQGRTQGKTLTEIAETLQRSPSTIGKWWRRVQDEGLQGLRTRPRGTKAKGALAYFPPAVAQTALELRRQRPKQGADHILSRLRDQPGLNPQRLPSRSRLAAFFKEQCPELLRVHRPKRSVPPRLVKASAVHEVWQLDSQEKIALADGSLATVCNIRDPFGAAMIASRAFSTKTDKRWRKLTWPEIRQVLRDGFTEWSTLPDCVQTDNELILVGNPSDPFPSHLTLWLVGLGIKHQTIRPHCPTDQAQVERTHRTLDEATYGDDSLANLNGLQAALDHERWLYNHRFPARASDCQAQPPVCAHPALLQPRRPYRPEAELCLFDLQRVYDYLATFTFERIASTSGMIGLEAHQRSVGRRYAGKAVIVRCDPVQHVWVVSERVQVGEQVEEKELVRRPVKYLDVEFLTGLKAIALPDPESIQLPLPCLV